MTVSVFDLFKIGIGPSSSHTVGPMRAARLFTDRLAENEVLDKTARVTAELFGSLGLTGRGHGTDKAVMLGLEGDMPDEVDPDSIPARLALVAESGRLKLRGEQEIDFQPKRDLVFNRKAALPYHPNGMHFAAFNETGDAVYEREYYSVGGGFVINTDEAARDELIVKHTTPVAHPFLTATELLRICARKELTIAEVMFDNELAWRSKDEIRDQLLRIWSAMEDCVERGCRQEGVLPGGLKVKRRAPTLHRELSEKEDGDDDALSILDWVNLYALAVNEENAAGGRVVTAPTNGAAGIIPAVLKYFLRFCPEAHEDKVVDFLLTAGAIGILYKENASISGAEVGCQGEVGVACSMAAGALAAVRGGTMAQVENAAEIGMEHNLGLTCDPIGGLVQIPCIERNAMGAVKAINAARMALQGDGKHHVTLDKVIITMRDTGRDMQTKYKETSRGGLAVNVIEC